MPRRRTFRAGGGSENTDGEIVSDQSESEEEKEAALAVSGELRLPATVEELFNRSGLSALSRDLIGHGVGYFLSDAYLAEAPHLLFARIGTYFRGLSVASSQRPHRGSSPFLYPKYGMNEVSQAFSRLSAINGGVTRMGEKIERIDSGQGRHEVRLEGGEVVVGKEILVNKEYLHLVGEAPPQSTQATVVRAVFVLRVLGGAGESKQVTVVGREIGRENDVLMLLVGEREGVAPEGYALCYASTLFEGGHKEGKGPPADLAVLDAQIPDLSSYFEQLGCTALEKHVWADQNVRYEADCRAVVFGDPEHGIDFESVYKDVRKAYRKILAGVRASVRGEQA